MHRRQNYEPTEKLAGGRTNIYNVEILCILYEFLYIYIRMKPCEMGGPFRERNGKSEIRYERGPFCKPSFFSAIFFLCVRVACPMAPILTTGILDRGYFINNRTLICSFWPMFLLSNIRMIHSGRRKCIRVHTLYADFVSIWKKIYIHLNGRYFFCCFPFLLSLIRFYLFFFVVEIQLIHLFCIYN